MQEYTFFKSEQSSDSSEEGLLPYTCSQTRYLIASIVGMEALTSSVCNNAEITLHFLSSIELPVFYLYIFWDNLLRFCL